MRKKLVLDNCNVINTFLTFLSLLHVLIKFLTKKYLEK